MTATDAEIIAALREGLTNEDVALQYSASPRRVASLRQAIGLPVTPKRGRLTQTPEQDARAAQLKTEGLAWAVIGRRLGVGGEAAKAAAKRHEERAA